MKQNYLYKCVECYTIKAVDQYYGEQTWGSLSCKACGDVVTCHRQIVMNINMIRDRITSIVFVCAKEKEDDSTGKEGSKEK